MKLSIAIILLVSFQAQAKPIHIMNITAYNATIGQTDDTPDITACGTKPMDRSVAVSRDLFAEGWTCGKYIWIEGYKHPFVINDKMGKYVTRKGVKQLQVRAIDIFDKSYQRSKQIGISRNVKVAFIGNAEDIFKKGGL